MLAAARFHCSLIFSLLAALCGVSFAQFQGVPPGQFQGVPTAPFHGVPAIPFQGVPAASFGVHTNNPSNFFLPSGFSPLVPVQSLEHGRHRRHHRDEGGAVAEPVYIPYAVPYAVNPDYDAEEDQDSAEPASGESSSGSSSFRTHDGGKRNSDHYMGRATGQYLNGTPGVDPDNGDASGYEDTNSAPEEAVPDKPEEPVIAQPPTVLVFRDGHRSDVLNYAIVGDTLFAFADGRSRRVLLADLDLSATRKANDDRGVEFKVPTN